MKPRLIFLNLALALFTAFVILTDGMPTQPRYIVFTMLVLVVPALTAFAVLGWGSRRDEFISWAVIALNTIVFAACCWIVSTEYASHPKEAGLLEYTILMLAVPLVNIVAFARHLWQASARHSFAV